MLEQSIIDQSYFEPIIRLIHKYDYNPVTQKIKMTFFKPHNLNVDINLVKTYFKDDAVLNYSRNEVELSGTIKSSELSIWLYIKIKEQMKLNNA